MESKKEIKYAGFGLRLLAYLIDLFIIVVPFMLVGFVVLLRFDNSEKIFVNLSLLLVFYFVLSSVISIFYQIFATAYWGGSIGKLSLGLKVVNENGSNLSLKESIVRYIVGYSVSGVFLGLGFWWIIKDPESRGWHDQIAGSWVSRKDHIDGLGVALFVSLFIFHALFLGAVILKFLTLSAS